MVNMDFTQTAEKGQPLETLNNQLIFWATIRALRGEWVCLSG
jgi:hypothetical protein